MNDIDTITQKQQHKSYALNLNQQQPIHPSIETLQTSEWHSEYLRLINKHINTDIIQNQKQNIANKIASYCLIETNEKELRISISSRTINSEVVEMHLTWRKYSMKIYILNVNGRRINHDLQKFKGSFGSIYPRSYNNNKVVIKCIHYDAFTNKNIAKLMAIKEYFILKLASMIEIGPHMENWFGFDLIFYSDCVQFLMEQCLPLTQIKQSQISNIYQFLYRLHLLNIIHYDLKPENMMFSPFRKNIVLIDFGLSDIVDAQIGFKTITKFRGSLNYCSPQMSTLFHSQKADFIDGYYNDIYGLQKVLKQLSYKARYFQLDDKQEQQQNIICYDDQERPQAKRTYLNILFQIKFSLTFGDIHTCEQLIESNLIIMAQFFLTDIFDFLLQLYPTQKIHKLYSKYFQTHHRQSIKYLLLNDIYDHPLLSIEYFSDIKLLIDQDKADMFKSYFDEIGSSESFKIDKVIVLKQYLLDNMDNSNQITYFSNFMRFISFNHNTFSQKIQDNMEIVSIFYIKNIQITDEQIKDKTKNMQIIKDCIEFIVNTVIKFNQNQSNCSVPKVRFWLIKTLIEHMFLLYIKPKSTMLSCLQSLFSKQYLTIQQKMQLLLIIKQSCVWLDFRIDSHDHPDIHELNDDVCKWCIGKSLTLSSLVAQNIFYYSIMQYICDYCKNIPNQKINFPAQINTAQQSLVSLLKISLVVSEFKNSNGSNFENMIIRIYQNIAPQQRNKIWFFKFDLIEFCLSQFYTEQALILINQWMQNIKCFTLMRQFRIYWIKNLHNYQKRKYFIKEFLMILLRTTHKIDIIKHLSIYHSLIKYFMSNLQNFTKLEQPQNQLIVNNIVDKIIKISTWITTQFIISIPNQISPHFHRCFQYNTMVKLCQIKIVLQRDGIIQKQKIIQFLSQIKIQNSNIIACTRCIFILQNFKFLMLLQFYALNINRIHYMSFFQKYLKEVMELNKNSAFQQLSNQYLMVALSATSLLCIHNIQYQNYYKGIKNFYTFIKQKDQFDQYIQRGYSTSKSIAVTLYILLRDVSMYQMTYFATKLSLYLKQHFNVVYFRTLVDSFELFLKQYQKDTIIPLSQLYQSLKSHKNHDNTFCIIFYYIILYRCPLQQINLSMLINNIKAEIFAKIGELTASIRRFILYQIYGFQLLLQSFSKNAKMRKMNYLNRIAVKIGVVLGQLKSKNSLLKSKHKVQRHTSKGIKILAMISKICKYGGPFQNQRPSNIILFFKLKSHFA